MNAFVLSTVSRLQGEQRDVVGRLLSRISTLQCAAAASEAIRRKLHNQMVELRGNVRFLIGGSVGGAEVRTGACGHAGAVRIECRCCILPAAV